MFDDQRDEEVRLTKSYRFQEALSSGLFVDLTNEYGRAAPRGGGM